MKVESESEVTQLCPTLCYSMDCSLPGSSVHGISQARVLEWVAIAFSKLKLLLLLLSHFSRVRLCNPIDGNPLGSSIPGILQARILEWVAISFSNCFSYHHVFCPGDTLIGFFKDLLYKVLYTTLYVFVLLTSWTFKILVNLPSFSLDSFTCGLLFLISFSVNDFAI